MNLILQTEAESVFLSEQILKSAEIAAGLQKNVSPMFLECTHSFRTEEGEWTENGNSC